MQTLKRTILLVLVLTIMLPALPAAAITLGAGESATFMFDFGSAPLASMYSIIYEFNVTGPSGASLNWYGEYSVFDELGEAAISHGSGGPFWYGYGLGEYVDTSPGLFNDPVSYLEITFSHGPTSGDTSANFEVTAVAYNSLGQYIGPINGVVQGVPEPTTMLLLGLGVAVLAGLRKKLT